MCFSLQLKISFELFRQTIDIFYSSNMMNAFLLNVILMALISAQIRSTIANLELEISIMQHYPVASKRNQICSCLVIFVTKNIYITFIFCFLFTRYRYYVGWKYLISKQVHLIMDENRKNTYAKLFITQNNFIRKLADKILN